MDPHKWEKFQKSLHRATDANTSLEDEKSIQSGIMLTIRCLKFSFLHKLYSYRQYW